MNAQDEQSQHVAMIHIKVNAALSMAETSLKILSANFLKQSQQYKIDHEIKKWHSEISKFADSLASVQEKTQDDFIAQIYNRAYAEGRGDVLMNIESASPSQLHARNKRIHENQQWLAKHNDFESGI